MTIPRVPAANRLSGFGQYLRVHQQYSVQIRQALRDTSRDLRAMLLAIDTSTTSGMITSAQYSAQRVALLQAQSQYWGTFGGITNRTLTEASRAAVAANQRLLAHLVSAGVPGAQDLVRGITAAAETSAERLAARQVNRIDLSPRVYQNQQLANGKVDAIINRGIAANQSARQIADAVFQYVNPGTPGGQSYASLRLGRTEINNSFHATTTAVYDDQPWVEATRWELSNSHPRPDECTEYAEEDGYNLGPGVFPTSRVPGKPHPNCLCYVTPVLPSPEQFADNLLGGGYNDWLAKEGLATF